MGSYSGSPTQHKTLVANTVDTVTLDQDYSCVEVVNRAATGDLYFTVDGSTPAVAGAGTYIVRAGEAVEMDLQTQGKTVVKLISTGALDYSVMGV
jgi:hypothetical protein